MLTWVHNLLEMCHFAVRYPVSCSIIGRNVTKSLDKIAICFFFVFSSFVKERVQNLLFQVVEITFDQRLPYIVFVMQKTCSKSIVSYLNYLTS